MISMILTLLWQIIGIIVAIGILITIIFPVCTVIFGLLFYSKDKDDF